MTSTLRNRIPLQKRKILKKTLGTAIGLLVLLGALSVLVVLPLSAGRQQLPGAVLRYGAAILWAWFGLVAVMLLWNPTYQWLYYAAYFYDADDRNIVIRKGVVAKKEITLPFSKITDVYVDQDLMDVVFGLYDVHMSTPTESSGQFAHIDGVDKAGSQQLRALLLERIHAAEDRRNV